MTLGQENIKISRNIIMINRTMRDGFLHLTLHHNNRLIKISLHKLHIYPDHRQYDDLYQEGCLAYAKAYVSFDGDPETYADLDWFQAYAYRRIYWRLLDLLKHSWNYVQAQETSVDQSQATNLALQAQADPVASQALQKADLEHALRYIRAHSTPLQNQYLSLVLDADLTNAEIARILGISRQSVYELRRRVQEVVKRYM
ncbi:sigma-70 family RNA polymerase sigma factor [Limosilactobacillus gastricus]|nr:sigma-70 family RNA polymerase sigma factor [Limosilactobacillus gastricus]